MTQYRHGALTVIETAKSQNEILRELKKIDPRLFLERQVTLENQAVWCVVCDVGGDSPPLTILEWRDSEDHPIHELSSGIVGRVQRMERDGGKLADRVIKQNAQRLEKQKAESAAHWRDIGTDFERLMSPGHSALLPRGQYLRRSRDRQRAKGWRI